MIVAAMLALACSEPVTPGPLTGTADYRITLQARGRFHDDTPDAMVEHLAALGAEAEVASANTRQIVLQLHRAAPAVQLIEALRPRRFRLERVEPAPELEDMPPEITVNAEGEYVGRCDSLMGWAALVPRNQCRAVYGEIRQRLFFFDCVVLCLDRESIATEADIAQTRVVINEWDHQARAGLTLTPEAAARFGAVIRNHVGQRLAIVIDEQVRFTSTLDTHTDSREVWITPDEPDREAKARALATSLVPRGRVTDEWFLVRVH